MQGWTCVADEKTGSLHVVLAYYDGRDPGPDVQTYEEDPRSAPPAPSYFDVSDVRSEVLEHLGSFDEDKYLASRLGFDPELIRALCVHEIIPAERRPDGGYSIDMTALIHWARNDEKLNPQGIQDRLTSDLGRLVSATAYGRLHEKDPRTIRGWLKEGKLQGKIDERPGTGGNRYWVWEFQKDDD